MKIIYLLLASSLFFITSCDLKPKKGEVKVIYASGSDPNDIKEGLHTFKYNNSSKIRAKINYTNGVKDGIAKEYYKSGQLKQEINYVMGKKVGVTKTYHTDGVLYKESFYKDNKATLRKYYYKDGKLKSEAPYLDGKPTIKLKEYYKSGKLKTKYPKIVVKENDLTALHDKVKLEFSLSEKRKGVHFYITDDIKKEVLTIDLKKYDIQAVPMNGSTGVLEIPIPKGNHMMGKLAVFAEYSTISGRKKIDKLVYNLYFKNY